jgi:hypothetical protein
MELDSTDVQVIELEVIDLAPEDETAPEIVFTRTSTSHTTTC